MTMRKIPETESGTMNAFAIAVLPQYANPATLNNTIQLNSQTILAENNSAFAQSVLNFNTSTLHEFECKNLKWKSINTFCKAQKSVSDKLNTKFCEMNLCL